MDSIAQSSPAKINLFLEILGKRPDGYHEVLSWMHTVDITDTVRISRSNLEYCTLKSADTNIPFGRRNLCIKAFEMFKGTVGIDQTVEISLVKTIPLGSGMGGGSSNAASVILALNKIFERNLESSKMKEIGGKVGTDVPFFIEGGSSLASGRGNELVALPKFPKPVWMVVVKPEVSISTGDAYQWMKGYKGERKIDEKELASKIERGDIEFMRRVIFNAFETVVAQKYPVITEAKNLLLAEGCIVAGMTGSGSGMFGICENKRTALKVAEAMNGWDKSSFVQACRTI